MIKFYISCSFFGLILYGFVVGFVDFRYFKLNLTELVTHTLFYSTCMQTESRSEISYEDDVGASSAECVVDERVEVDNDEGPEICEADR